MEKGRETMQTMNKVVSAVFISGMIQLMVFSVLEAGAADGVWTNGVSGNWSAPACWSNDVVAGGAGSTAHFWGPEWPGCNPLVTVNTNAVVGQLWIGGLLEGNNQRWNFNASGGNSLTLDSGSAAPALILGTEPNGSKKHNINFNVPLVINSDLLLHSPRTDLTANDGSSSWLSMYGGISEGVSGRGVTVSNATAAARCEIGGASLISGAVRVQSGILRLATPTAGCGITETLGTHALVTVAGGPGALDLNNFTVGADKSLLLAGAGTGLGALISTKQMRNQRGTWSGPVVLKGSATVGGTGANNFRRGGCELLVSGAISEDGGNFPLIKAGDGMLYLTAHNSYSGGTVISQDNGYGGINAISAENLGSGPVIFNGGMFQFGADFDLSEMLLVSTNGNALKLDTNGRDVTLAGNLTPAINGGLFKFGLGTLTLSGANTHSGSTMPYAGTLVLDYSTHASNKIVNELHPRGSFTVKLVGTDVTFDQTLGKLYWGWQTAGEVTLTNASNSVQFSITRGDALNRYSPGTLDFGTSGGKFYVNQALGAGNIMGGFVTYGKATWATKDGSSFITGLSAYDSAWGASDNKDMTVANVAESPSGMVVNTLRFNNTDADHVPLTMTLTGNNMLSSGGVLVTANMGDDPVTITGGSLSATNRSISSAADFDLTVHQHNTRAPLVISSAIVNSTAPVGLTKSGMGTLVVSNSASTYTGPIYVNNGQLTVYSPQDLGAANQSVRLINGSVLQLIGSYSVANTISIDSVGGGVDIPAGSSITLTQPVSLGNYQSVFRKTGAGTCILGNYAREIGEFSVEGGTLVLDDINKAGWAGTIVRLANRAVIKNRAVLNHNNNGLVLKVDGSGGSVDLDGASAALNTPDYLCGGGTLTVTNSGAGTPTFAVNYQQTVFTGVLAVELGATTFRCADMPVATLQIGSAMIWNPLNAFTRLGGIAGAGTFDLSNKTLFISGEGDSEFAGLLKGSGAIVKAGGGTWSVTAVDFSQYSGSITVSNGTLAANSAMTWPVTLSGAGTLGGTGSVSQVTMVAGGVISPGGGTVGRLSIGSTLVLGGGLNVDVHENGAADLLQVEGDLTLGALAALVVADPNQLMKAGSYLIATWTGERSGVFGTVNLPSRWSVEYDDAGKRIYLKGPLNGTVIIIR